MNDWRQIRVEHTQQVIKRYDRKYNRRVDRELLDREYNAGQARKWFMKEVELLKVLQANSTNPKVRAINQAPLNNFQIKHISKQENGIEVLLVNTNKKQYDCNLYVVQVNRNEISFNLANVKRHTVHCIDRLNIQPIKPSIMKKAIKRVAKKLKG